VYYREAVGAIIVFDVTRPATFESVLKWKKDLDEKARVLLKDGTTAPIPTLLFANKADLLTTSNKSIGGLAIEEEWNLPVAKKDMDGFCKEHGFLEWYETSAKLKCPEIDLGTRKMVKQLLLAEQSESIQTDPKVEFVEPNGKPADTRWMSCLGCTM